MGPVGCLIFALFFAAIDAKRVPAIYVFGDSLADVGNNNYLTGSTVPKADYSPYGIDFPLRRQTGRFSNGYNCIDFLAIDMGFRRSPPPYLSLSNKISHQIWKGYRGVNFASGDSGILDSTGVTITLTEQIEHFTKFRSNLATRMGTKMTRYMLSESIFIISSGGNDIFALWAKNISPSKTEKEQIIRTLMSKFSEHLKNLYNLGARKFLIWNMGVVGCCPYARTLHPSNACIDVINDLSVDFNKALSIEMSNLSLQWKGMKYSIANTYEFISDIMENPTYHGNTEVKKACCGSGKLNAEVRCNQNTTYCADRNHYLYWDMLHPSEATSKKYAVAIFSGHSQFVSPISVMQLIEA